MDDPKRKEIKLPSKEEVLNVIKEFVEKGEEVTSYDLAEKFGTPLSEMNKILFELAREKKIEVKPHATKGLVVTRVAEVKIPTKEELRRKLEEVVREERERKFKEVFEKLASNYKTYLIATGMKDEDVEKSFEMDKRDIELLAREVAEGGLTQERALELVRSLAKSKAKPPELVLVTPVEREVELPEEYVEALRPYLERLTERIKRIHKLERVPIKAEVLAEKIAEEIVEEIEKAVPGIYVVTDETGKVWLTTPDKVEAGYKASVWSLEYPNKTFTIWKKTDGMKKLEAWKNGSVLQIVPFSEW